MRSYLPDFNLLAPTSLDEALALLGDESGRWRPFSGGTDVMVLFEAGKLAHKDWVSLWQLEELRGIELSEEAVTIGGLTSYAELQECAVLQSEFPLLTAAARVTGSVAIQSRGTIGGNIANASPAADSPPALLCYDTELELVSNEGRRWIPYEGFHTGYKQMRKAPGELISRLRLKRNTGGKFHFYEKVGTRRAQSISKVVFAGLGRLEAGAVVEARIAIGSVAPITLRCSSTEAASLGRALSSKTRAAAQDALAEEITPIDDIRSTAQYRRRVAANLLGEFLGKLAAQG